MFSVHVNLHFACVHSCTSEGVHFVLLPHLCVCVYEDERVHACVVCWLAVLPRGEING